MREGRKEEELRREGKRRIYKDDFSTKVTLC